VNGDVVEHPKGPRCQMQDLVDAGRELHSLSRNGGSLVEAAELHENLGKGQTGSDRDGGKDESAGLLPGSAGLRTPPPAAGP
jgi:hypothetical protein